MLFRVIGILMILLSTLLAKPLFAQEIKTYNFKELEPAFHHQNDTTYVINFWAMWCKPCVEELPEFEHLRESYSEEKVKLLLVSLDFGKNVETRLTQFLTKKGIHIETVILDDPDANSWIGKVNSKWDGALPATIVYKKNQRKFFNGKITHNKLAKTIDQFNR